MGLSPVLKTLAELVRINSVNPAYEGGQSEAEIVSFIADFFGELGIETQGQEVFPGRPNLIARVPGANPERLLVFEAHTDTASVTGMSIPPFEPEISEGHLYGRGSCDTKAGLAAMMHALAAIGRDAARPPCEVRLVAAADEEYSFRGVLRFCEGLEAAGAVVSEPTCMRAVIAHKGCLRWKISCKGKAAHSSKPELGVNAISHMARVVLELEQDSRRLAALSHPLVGSPTCSVGLIQGGTQVNIVPDGCSIEIDRRLIPGEQTPRVLSDYETLLQGVKAACPELDAQMEPPMLEDLPLGTPPGSPVASIAAEILGELGLNSDFAGVPYGSDASKLSRAGIPSILVGPGSIDQAHAAVEYVDCDQTEQALEFYRRFMMRFE